MKIGMITFHHVDNYGACLQAYALSKAIENYGYNIKIIDFRSVKKNDKSFKGQLRKFKKIISFLVNYGHFVNKKDKFKLFRDKFNKPTIKKYYSVDDLKKTEQLFDSYICGSDQIWNPLKVSNCLPYFLNFVDESKKLKISYAASFGTDKINGIYWNQFGNELKRIHHISVREKSGIHLVKELSEREAIQVLDPVFLLNKNQWEEIIDSNYNSRKYILFYTLQKNQLLLNAAKTLAKEQKIDIIHVPLYTWDLKKLSGIDRVVKDAGPIEFLSLLKNASYVCTNSFHGVAFSILFQKPFLVVQHRNDNIRIPCLLKQLDLSSQILSDKITMHKLIDNRLAYDFKKTFELLEVEIEKSKRFLREALRSAVN
jgi:hypothetical protein